jgi:hypothetical protein
MTEPVTRHRRTKKKSPTEAEALERRQLREHWDKGFRQRCPTVDPLDWGAEGGKRHSLVIRVLRDCKGLVGAMAHLDRYFGRYDTSAFWREHGLSFEEACSGKCIETLPTANMSGPLPNSRQVSGIAAAPKEAFLAYQQRQAKAGGNQ